jgi:hypothetical protein
MPTIKKEHAFLAGGIVGGCILGAGLYAAYQAIKYRGMRMVCNSIANAATHMHTLSCMNQWDLFDQNNNYNQKKAGEIFEYIHQKLSDPLIDQEIAQLKELRDHLRQYNITCKQNIDILEDTSNMHAEMYKQIMHKNANHNVNLVDSYSKQLHTSIKNELGHDIDGIDVYVEPSQNGIRIYPFCFRMKRTKIPVPIHILYETARCMDLGISLTKGKPCNGSFGCEE